MNYSYFYYTYVKGFVFRVFLSSAALLYLTHYLTTRYLTYLFAILYTSLHWTTELIIEFGFNSYCVWPNELSTATIHFSFYQQMQFCLFIYLFFMLCCVKLSGFMLFLALRSFLFSDSLFVMLCFVYLCFYWSKWCSEKKSNLSTPATFIKRTFLGL